MSVCSRFRGHPSLLIVCRRPVIYFLCIYFRNEIRKCLYTIFAINFSDQISIIGFLSRKIKSVLKWWGVTCTRKSLASHFTEMKAYVQCNIQGQKLDPRCEINKHIFVFTYQLYKFMLVVYNYVHHFANNRAFVAK
jgi:hypothetical protein